MNWILSGIITFFANIVATVMDILMLIFIDSVDISMQNFSITNLDGLTTLNNFFAVFPLAKELQTSFIYFGYFILYMILIYQLFKAFFGPLVESEDPVKLTARTCFYTLLVAKSALISKLIISLFIIPFTIIKDSNVSVETTKSIFSGGIDTALDTISSISVPTGWAGFVLTAEATTIGGIVGGVTIVAAFLILILFGIMCTQYIKFLIEFIERYVILGFLAICAPLAVACGASQNTKHIFNSWVQMLISQGLLMCFGMFFLKVFNSSVAYSAANLISTPGLNIFTILLYQLAWLRLATRVDQHLATAGLGVAQAGGGLGADLFMGARAVMPFASAISDKALGTNISSGNGGKGGMGGGRMTPNTIKGLYNKGKQMMNGTAQGGLAGMASNIRTQMGHKRVMDTGNLSKFAQANMGQPPKTMQGADLGQGLLKSAKVGANETVQNATVSHDGQGNASAKVVSTIKGPDGQDHAIERQFSTTPFKDANGHDAQRFTDDKGNEYYMAQTGDGIGQSTINDNLNANGQMNADLENVTDNKGNVVDTTEGDGRAFANSMQNQDFTDSDSTGQFVTTDDETGMSFLNVPYDSDMAENQEEAMYWQNEEDGSRWVAINQGRKLDADTTGSATNFASDLRDNSEDSYKLADYKENKDAGVGGGTADSPSDMLYKQNNDGSYTSASKEDFQRWQEGKQPLYTADCSHGDYEHVQSDGFDSQGKMRSKVLESSNPVVSASSVDTQQNAKLAQVGAIYEQTKTGERMVSMDSHNVNSQMLSKLKEGKDYQRYTDSKNCERIRFRNETTASKSAVVYSSKSRPTKDTPITIIKNRQNTASTKAKATVRKPNSKKSAK